LGVILAGATARASDPRLLVGYEERDDAAVYDLGDGTAVISTTDFFMPIVDDPRDFGRIAAVNALSDVYAMGGSPMVAISVLGWPVGKIPAEAANLVVEGARDACEEAGIPLGGGHSIDNPEPVFGLAVTGRVKIKHLKRNGGARPGDLLFLTKPIGVGVFTTAWKAGKLADEHAVLARDVMVAPNAIGADLGEADFVHALTDVTGFGLLGHLAEMCEASGLSAVIRYEDVPRLEPEALDGYVEAGCVPGGTKRNWLSYGDGIGPLDESRRLILCDPQTSGGLLVAVDPAHEADFQAIAARRGLALAGIGGFEKRGPHLVEVA
jgi:selenide,water dikinase